MTEVKYTASGALAAGAQSPEELKPGTPSQPQEPRPESDAATTRTAVKTEDKAATTTTTASTKKRPEGTSEDKANTVSPTDEPDAGSESEEHVPEVIRHLRNKFGILAPALEPPVYHRGLINQDVMEMYSYFYNNGPHIVDLIFQKIDYEDYKNQMRAILTNILDGVMGEDTEMFVEYMLQFTDNVTLFLSLISVATLTEVVEATHELITRAQFGSATARGGTGAGYGGGYGGRGSIAAGYAAASRVGTGAHRGGGDYGAVPPTETAEAKSFRGGPAGVYGAERDAVAAAGRSGGYDASVGAPPRSGGARGGASAPSSRGAGAYTSSSSAMYEYAAPRAERVTETGQPHVPLSVQQRAAAYAETSGFAPRESRTSSTNAAAGFARPSTTRPGPATPLSAPPAPTSPPASGTGAKMGLIPQHRHNILIHHHHGLAEFGPNPTWTGSVKAAAAAAPQPVPPSQTSSLVGPGAKPAALVQPAVAAPTVTGPPAGSTATAGRGSNIPAPLSVQQQQQQTPSPPTASSPGAARTTAAVSRASPQLIPHHHHLHLAPHHHHLLRASPSSLVPMGVPPGTTPSRPVQPVTQEEPQMGQTRGSTRSSPSPLPQGAALGTPSPATTTAHVGTALTMGSSSPAPDAAPRAGLRVPLHHHHHNFVRPVAPPAARSQGPPSSIDAVGEDEPRQAGVSQAESEELRTLLLKGGIDENYVAATVQLGKSVRELRDMTYSHFEEFLRGAVPQLLFRQRIRGVITCSVPQPRLPGQQLGGVQAPSVPYASVSSAQLKATQQQQRQQPVTAQLSQSKELSRDLQSFIQKNAIGAAAPASDAAEDSQANSTVRRTPVSLQNAPKSAIQLPQPRTKAAQQQQQLQLQQQQQQQIGANGNTMASPMEESYASSEMENSRREATRSSARTTPMTAPGAYRSRYEDADESREEERGRRGGRRMGGRGVSFGRGRGGRGSFRDGGEETMVCKYYNRPEGCQFGDRCRFIHTSN